MCPPRASASAPALLQRRLTFRPDQGLLASAEISALFKKLSDESTRAAGGAPPLPPPPHSQHRIVKDPVAPAGRTVINEPNKRVHFHSAEILPMLLKSSCFAFKWIRSSPMLTKERADY